MISLSRRLLIVAMTGVAGALLPASAQAQANPDAHCREVLRTFIDSVTVTRVRDACKGLAVYVGQELLGPNIREALRTKAATDTTLQTTPRKLQPLTGQANISGVPGQSDAVPSAQPTALASANLSAVGTDDGTKTLTAISLNPLTLFGSNDTEAAAKWSRVSDFTILIPTQTEGSSSIDLGYFGVRGRINMTGLSAGDRLLKDVTAAFLRATEAEAFLDSFMMVAFRGFPDSATVAGCASAMLRAEYGDSPAACLGQVTFGVSPAIYDTLHHSILRAREKADARYLGLDLRFDRGDPTLANDPTKDVTALQAGLAYGRSLPGPNPYAVSFGMTSRLGVRYSKLRSDSGDAVYSVDGALGFEMNRLLTDIQMVHFSVGLEFRYANKSDATADIHQTDNLALRGALEIPILGGTSITVAFTAPIVGDLTPSLSMNFNWGLLMSAIAQSD
jgi:hypothetical protein